METTIRDWINFFLVIIPIGATCRIIQCLTAITYGDESNVGTYKTRAKNTFIFAICAECIMSIIFVVEKYFVGGIG